MRRSLALLVTLMLPLLSGCTALFGERMLPPGSGENGGTGGNGGSGGSGGGGGTCVPVRCADVGAVCGAITDGCGGTLSCGDCSAGQTCGGGGPNRCGTGACAPQTCAQVGASCGQFSDGCAGVLDCGPCACTPTTCAAHPTSCGALADGCGHTLDCGICPSGVWHSLGNSTAELHSVAYSNAPGGSSPASGLWIAALDGSVLHSTDDVHFDTMNVQSSLSALHLDASDVWVGGADGISYQQAGTTGFSLIAGSPKLIGGIDGSVVSLFATSFSTEGAAYSNFSSTWTAAKLTPAPGPLFAVFAPSFAEAYAIGARGVIYHTADSGQSWAAQTSGTAADLFCVWGNGSLVIVAGAAGTFLRSTNGGATWTRSTVGSSPIYGLSGTSTTDIWAVGKNATLLHSVDGGASWSQESDVSGATIFYDVAAADGKVYVVGESGTILERSN
jgi:hypothetical protein